MIVVDSHVHIALHTYEPVEMLLTQMQYNNVEKTVLVQSSSTTDNSYLMECQRRFPSRLAVVCRVDVDSPAAVEDLKYWRDQGADSVRLRNFNRSPGGDPLAIWRRAAGLGMTVSVGGKIDGFISDEFTGLVKTLPDLRLVIEHLGGMGFNAVHDARPSLAQYQKVLELARFPNTFIKIHGMGEICDPPFPYQDIPPYLRMAYDAFGARRMAWGSDYPPVVLREGYRNSLQFTREQLPFCSQEELEWIFGRTALSLWRFP
jgi:L-fuconolactonase